MKDIFKYIEIITTIFANMVVIIGVTFGIKSFKFNKIKLEISENLKIKQKIRNDLMEHVNQYNGTNYFNIGLRIVQYRSYPFPLIDDGYKLILYKNKSLYLEEEFLTKTGILVEETIGSGINNNFSLYLDSGNHGMFIIDESNKIIKGFYEVSGKIKFVRTLKYKNIVNWDFNANSKIEYEPVIYTRYKYNNKKLYEKEIKLQIRNNNDFILPEVLYTYNSVSSNKSIKYLCITIIKNIYYKLRLI